LATSVLLFALASALLHATWNAAARATPDPAITLRVIVIVAGIWMIPVLFWFGLPAREALPYMFVGCCFNMMAVFAMGRAYRTTDFAIAYPLTRGLSPIIVLLGAGVLFSDWPNLFGIFGVLVLSGGLILLVLVAHGQRADRTGLLWAGLAAFGVGTNIMLDSQGLKLTPEPFSYAAAGSVMNAIIISVLSLRERAKLIGFIRQRPLFSAGWTIVSNLSYGLSVIALAIGPAAVAAALRETSMLFATFIAALLYKDRIKPAHWLAVGLAVAGAMLMRGG